MRQNFTIPFRVYLPPWVVMKLNTWSHEERVPIGRIVSRLVVEQHEKGEAPRDHEVDLHFDWNPGAYANQAYDLLTWMRTELRGPIAREALLLMRGDFGLADRSMFMRAYKELRERQLIIEEIAVTSGRGWRLGDVIVRPKTMGKEDVRETRKYEKKQRIKKRLLKSRGYTDEPKF